MQSLVVLPVCSSKPCTAPQVFSSFPETVQHSASKHNYTMYIAHITLVTAKQLKEITNREVYAE